MEILKNSNNLNIVVNSEQNFRTDLGWQDNLADFEDEILKDIINPSKNNETVRYIHKPYDKTISGITMSQTDIWFQFYFSSGDTPNYVLDYNPIGITTKENELINGYFNLYKSYVDLVKYKNNQDKTKKRIFLRLNNLIGKDLVNIFKISENYMKKNTESFAP